MPQILFPLVVFYSFQFFFSSKMFYFLSFFILAFFLWRATRNLTKSLSYALVLALFSEIGLAGSLFVMEPRQLNPDIGWWISPISLIVLCLLPLSLANRLVKKIKITDLLVAAFLFWNSLVIVFYPFSQNVLYSVFGLTELTAAYFLLRINLSKEDLKPVVYLIVSALLFQSFLGGLQASYGRNVGSVVEPVNLISPYGLTTIESDDLFRVTGGSGHANLFAVNLVTLMPFLFMLKIMIIPLLIVIPLMLLLTFSRLAWAIGGIIFLSMIVIFKKKQVIKLKYLLAFSLPFIVFLPLVSLRIFSFSEAFSPGGSWDVRYRVWQEAFGFLKQYPLTGIGQNRFQQLAQEQRTSYVFRSPTLSPATKIHNIFLEIATETGLTGLTVFVIFIISLFNLLRVAIKKNKKNEMSKTLLLSLIGLLAMSQFHPLFHTAQFRLYYLLAVLITVV